MKKLARDPQKGDPRKSIIERKLRCCSFTEKTNLRYEYFTQFFWQKEFVIKGLLDLFKKSSKTEDPFKAISDLQTNGQQEYFGT